MNINQLRKDIKAWLFENISGKKIYNESIKSFIIVNRNGLKHGLSFSSNNFVQKLKSFHLLEEVIKNTVYIKSKSDKKNKKQIKEIIIFNSTVEVEETTYSVRLIVRYTNEAKFYYDHALIKIKKRKNM